MIRNIPILMYHQVTPNVNPRFAPSSVTPGTFALQIKILHLLGYKTVDLSQLESCSRGNSTLPRKPIVITFDDCYRDSVDYALPILKSYGFTAVFFVPTNYIGKRSHWLMPELGIEFPIIDWNAVKHLDTNGFQIGSHSMSHPRLAEISPKDCFNELVRSRKTLEDKLGHEIVHLAYPYGSFNENVRDEAAKAGYRTSCTTEERFAKLEDDLLALPRINVMGYNSILDFILQLHFQGKYNTTRRWWLYTHSKILGMGRLIKRIRAKLTDK